MQSKNIVNFYRSYFLEILVFVFFYKMYHFISDQTINEAKKFHKTILIMYALFLILGNKF